MAHSISVVISIIHFYLLFSLIALIYSCYYLSILCFICHIHIFPPATIQFQHCSLMSHPPLEDKHLHDGGGPSGQQRFGLYGGEEGVGALEAQAWQESPHDRHHRLIKVQPADQALQILLPEHTERHTAAHPLKSNNSPGKALLFTVSEKGINQNCFRKCLICGGGKKLWN